MAKTLVFALLLAAGQAFGQGGSIDEAAMGEKLTAEAEKFLVSLLGPGRAKVLVTVEGERSNTQTQTEILTPITKPAGVEPALLPGYAKERTKEEKWDFTQKDQEQTSRISGLIVKRLRVSIVIDSKVPESQANAARRLLSDMLGVDPKRGDQISVLRAQLAPAWKSALETPEGTRTILLFSGAVVLVLLVSLLGYFAAIRVVRAFVSELGQNRRRASDSPPPYPPQGMGASLPGAQSAELLPGGIPSLLDSGSPDQGAAAGLPQLGRRFDFLSSKDPLELSKLLADESPDDLALLFGYLADSNPDLAATVLQALPAPAQTAVSQALVRLTMADPERLAMLENKIRTLVEFGLRGTERLGKILSRLPPMEREGIMGDIQTASPDAAKEIENSLFSFEDILKLKPNEMRRLIMAVPYTEWGLALRSAPAELVEKISEQLLPGTKKILSESMETPQPRNKVLEARSAILAQVYAMASRGEISLGREDASSELI